MPRTKLIVGNWKMFTSAASGKTLATAIATGVTNDRVRVAVCPPFPYLAQIGEVLRGSRVALGAQNMYPVTEGAFTGEISPAMLLDVGCKYVITGHSERRHGLGETDEFINQKVCAAIEAGLHVILCVGETLEEREEQRAKDVLRHQLALGLDGFDPINIAQLTIAYEPVWAIGTGKTATPALAQEAHAYVRHRFTKAFGLDAADHLVIQYGGSVKPENVAELLHQPDVDGALVGGASLKADLFLGIIRSAA